MLALLLASIACMFTDLPTAQALTVSLSFYGPYDEVLGATNYFKYEDGSEANCTVTVYLEDVIGDINSITSFVLNSTYIPYFYNYSSVYTPSRIDYTIIDTTGATNKTYYREYWVTDSDLTGGWGSFDVYMGHDTTTYTIAFLDYSGVLKNNPYIIAKYETLFDPAASIEKRIVDSQKIVVFNLIPNTKYQLYYSDGTTETYYGEVTTTSTTSIQLTIRGLEFSDSVLQLYQYVHMYAVRDFLNPIGSITVSYEDTTSLTNDVTITITNTATGIVAYTNVEVAQTFSDTWSSAVNATNYQVNVEVDHQTFGVFEFNQYLLGEYTTASDPFSLEFLGELPVSTAVLLPALLIIMVAGVFSELTSEAAAVITCIIAIVLTALGWIDIGQGAIIAALALSVMAGIVTVRRRMY